MCGEQPGPPVRQNVQLRITQCHVLGDQRDRVRAAVHLLLEQARQRPGRHHVGGTGPVGQEPAAFVRIKNVDRGERPVRVGGDLLKEPDHPSGQMFRGGVGETVGRVLQQEADPACRGAFPNPLHEGEVQVELRGHDFGGVPVHRLPEQGAAVVATTVVTGHHLEQRVPASGPGRVQRRDHLLERDVLVVEGGKIGLTGPGQQLGEGRVTGQVGTQDEGVDEEANQVIQCLVGTAGDWNAERDVLTRSQPVQQGRDGGMGQHRHARTGPRTQGTQRLRRHIGHLEPHPGTDAVTGRRPRPVQRQRDLLGQVAQRVRPEGQLPGGHAVRIRRITQEALLPQRVVGILHRQRRPSGRRTISAGGVGGVQVT